ncbi:MAG: hypothetical protein QOE25_70, partial [Actinomycetota bacterium]|nr:hypothetical protein [Actinomycetota bacterium]
MSEAVAAAVSEPPRKGRALDWITTTDHKKIGILYL